MSDPCAAVSARAADALTVELPAGTVLHTIHRERHPAGGFSPGVDATGARLPCSRFAPVTDSAGALVPYLYAGSTLECAICETVFHDVAFDAVAPLVRLRLYGDRVHSLLRLNAPLTLVDLTSDGLRRLRVTRAALIDSGPTAYPRTAVCAQALHQALPAVHGLTWVSRQRDTDRAYVLFGDSAAGLVQGSVAGPALKDNDHLRESILGLGLRLGISIVGA